jgi:PAS domain S-box-containing protein
MEEQQSYLRRELDRIFQQWSARAATVGAVMFLLLSPLDFYSDPPHARRFLGYRLAVAALLLAAGAVIRRARRLRVMQLVVLAGVAASAIALEAMILQFGGYHSPYLLGLVLLAVVVAGLIPSGAGFAALAAAVVLGVYAVPLLLWDRIREPQYFAVNLTLFFCVLAAGVLVRWFHTRHVADEIAARFALTRSRELLEREVAGRAAADAALRESRDLLTPITAAAMDAIVIIDPDGAVRYWNAAAEQIFGYAPGEAIGRAPFTFLLDPEKAEALLTDFRAWQGGGAALPPGRRFVSRGRRKGGETFPMELAMSLVLREGRPWVCALLSDITERAANEDRLSLLAAAVEGAAEGIYIVDLGGKVVSCNPAAVRQSGHTLGEVLGHNIRTMHPHSEKLDSEILPAVQRSGGWAGEISGTARDGAPVELWLTASLVRDAAGRPIAMVGLTRDLADQRRLEAEHVRAQKLESIGVLAGGLAHDFNNLLTIILGNIDLARLFAGANPEAAEAFDHAAEAALRAGDLTRQLITFSKGGQPVKRVGSITRVVRDTVLFAAAGSSVACEFDLPGNLPAIEFDEGQMRQVFHNLVQNAREAMPGGGTLRVSACALQVERNEVPGLAAGSYLCLQFADRGTGIAQAHLSRIFDPYFSTKEMDTVKGRGLGLAVSFSIVRSHGGTIAADSRIGEGTTISVYLPETSRATEDDDEEEDDRETAEAAAATEAREPGSERLPEGPARGRVLVLDDEPLVLEMAGAALRRLGYAAKLCVSGAEAVVQYQIGLDTGKRFDAVILDLTVPGGPGGPETLARLREIDPEVRAALSSGYTDHPAVADWAGAGFAAFIAKPYSLKAFEETLARLT